MKRIRLNLTDVVGIEFLPEFTGLFKQIGNAVANPDGSFILKFWFFKQDFLFDLFGLANKFALLNKYRSPPDFL